MCETAEYLVVRGDSEEIFFSYRFGKEKSKILYSHYRRRISNAFCRTIFNRHHSMIKIGAGV